MCCIELTKRTVGLHGQYYLRNIYNNQLIEDSKAPKKFSLYIYNTFPHFSTN